MKTLSTALALVVSCLSLCAGILEVREVAPTATNDTDAVTLKYGENSEEKLHIMRTVILSENDVKSAQSGPESMLFIDFNENGTNALFKTTSRMTSTRGRLAIFVDGSILTAPAVMEPINDGKVQINLQGVLTDTEGTQLARKLSGLPAISEEEIAASYAPPIKTTQVPISDEEYAKIKQQRIQAGIHCLETFPDEAVIEALKPGMPRAEITKLLGPPTVAETDAKTGTETLMYSLAPERIPLSAPNPNELTSLMLTLNDERLSSHFTDWTTVGPSCRIRYGNSYSTPRMPLKDFGWTFTVEEFRNDPIGTLESLEIGDPTQEMYLGDLLTLLAMVNSSFQADTTGEGNSIDANCDIIVTLAHHIEEIGALRATTTTQGAINIDSLQEVTRHLVASPPPGFRYETLITTFEKQSNTEFYQLQIRSSLAEKQIIELTVDSETRRITEAAWTTGKKRKLQLPPLGLLVHSKPAPDAKLVLGFNLPNIHELKVEDIVLNIAFWEPGNETQPAE